MNNSPPVAIVHDYGGYYWQLQNGRFLRATPADWQQHGGDKTAVSHVIWFTNDIPPAEPDDITFINMLITQQQRRKQQGK